MGIKIRHLVKGAYNYPGPKRRVAWLLVPFFSLFILTILLTTGAVVAGQASVMAVPYLDVSIPAGVVHTHTRYTGYWGVGQAWGDYDGDGNIDLYVTTQNGSVSNKLFRNLGDGTFALAPIQATVALTSTKSGGAVFADYDNDGDSDLYVLNDGPNILFRNDFIETGVPGFTDVTATAGVADPGKGQTAGWGDYDQDGFLDLYVANWRCEMSPGVPCTPSTGYDGSADKLYHNQGDGTFVDVSDLLTYSRTLGSGFVGSFLDYDNDGDLDIYVVNDEFANPIGNVLWRNDGPGPNCALAADEWCFADVSAATNTDITLCGMGLAIGDYDADLDLDVYFSNAPACGPNKPNGIFHLLQNQTVDSSPIFSDVSGVTNSGVGGVGWGAVFLDYNNDSYMDLFVSRSSPDLPSVLFYNERNPGTGSFLDISNRSGNAIVAQGVAYADYDRDGWVDLVTCPHNGACTLFRNQMGTGGNNNGWLAVELDGGAGSGINRDAIGARVYVTLDNGRVLMQEVKSGSSIGAGNQLALHFGLDNQAIQQIEVVWPDGLSELFLGIDANQYWPLSYPAAGADLSAAAGQVAVPNAVITYEHTLRNDGNRPDQFSLSANGPASATVEPALVDLAPGGMITAVVTVQVPITEPMTLTTTVTVQSGNDPSLQLQRADVTEVVWPAVSFASADYAAVEGSGVITITAVLDRVPATATSVNYATTDDSATAGSDYEAAVGLLTFPAGSTMTQFTVILLDDFLIEPSQQFFINLSTPDLAILGVQSETTVTIIDDDLAVYLPVVRHEFP